MNEGLLVRGHWIRCIIHEFSRNLEVEDSHSMDYEERVKTQQNGNETRYIRHL